MCGIAGIVSLTGKPVDTERLKPMCDAQAHRGPDDAGYVFFRLGKNFTGQGGYWCAFADPDFSHINEHLPVLGGEYSRDELSRGEYQVALGHRRLSILDLTHYGHQPMANSDQRFWITYNGEIYNYPELKKELSADHIFRTRSDTEVILKLYKEDAEKSFARLNGMFAFALYDRLKNEMVLARDRFGVKPLYYAVAGDYLVFASEVKGILASGLVTPEIYPPALVEYFTFQNRYGRDTLFRNIRMLGPGEYLSVKPGSGRVGEPVAYNPGALPPDRELSDAGSARELVAQAFADAVKRQLLSDVPVGAYLSGGMDSGSIVSVAGRSIPRLNTFTAGFDLTNVNGIEQGFDERELAEQLSYILQTEHYAVVLHAGDMPAAMERISWHMDDLCMGMCHQNWYAAKLASKFVKVCLAGAGGDELFAGYPWRYRPGLGQNSQAECDDAYFLYWHRLLPQKELPALFADDQIRAHIPRCRELFDAVLKGAPPAEPDMPEVENQLQRMLYFEFRTFMHGFLITEDRMSMAHSMESRVPFLDNELADLAWRIPPSLKLNTASLAQKNGTGHIESTEGKRILRSAMEDYLPAEFTRQHKQGFSPPDENWYRGPSMDYIKSVLLDERTRQRPWFDQNFVEGCLNDHFSGKRNHRLLIWSLLSFEWLQRHYVDQPAAEHPKRAYVHLQSKGPFPRLS